MGFLANAGSSEALVALAIRETEAWTVGSVVAGVILALIVAGVVWLLLHVTLRR